MHEREQVAPDDVVGPVTEHVLERGADVGRARLVVDDDDHVRRVPHERAEAFRRPPQRFDGGLGVGRVARVRHDATNGGNVHHVREDVLEPTPRAVGVPHPAAHPCPLARRRAHVLQRRGQLGDVGRVDDVVAVTVEPRRDGMPEDAFVRRRQVRQLAVGVDDREEVEAALHERAEPLLALAQRQLRVLPVGDVAEVADQSADVRVGEQVDRDDLGPHPTAVGPPDPGLGGARLVGMLEEPGEVLAEAREVVRDG